MTTVNTIHTPCKSCVFAIYDNQTQTGCSLSYLEGYKEEGLLLEAYDEDKEFYIINSKKCIGYRENKWFDQFNMSNSTVEEKILKFYETNKLHYLLFIDLKNITYDQLDDICNQVSLSVSQPKKIIFIRHNNEILDFTYEKIEKLIKKYNINYTWRIQTMLDDSLSSIEILHNIVVINPKYRFVVSVSEYSGDIMNTINETNDIIHNKLEQFIVASNPQHSCIIFGGGVYRFAVAGNENILSNKEAYRII